MIPDTLNVHLLDPIFWTFLAGDKNLQCEQFLKVYQKLEYVINSEWIFRNI